MDCLNNIIKLSRTECTCFDTDKPVDVSEGQADIYLDELEGLTLSLVDAASDCEEGSLWKMMTKARENSIKQFKADLLSCIGTNYTSKRQNFSGIVGSVNFTKTLIFPNTLAGYKVQTYNIVGGHMTIKQIGLMFNTTASFNISVYSNENVNTPIAIYPVTSAANNLQYITLGTPLKLPLWSNSVSTLEYYFVYDLVGTYAPKDNKVDCGCSNKAGALFKNWVNVKGIKGDPSIPFTNYTDTVELNGIVLDATFNCDSTRLICSDEYPLDFEGDGRAMQFAYAVRFKAGEILIEDILASGNINRYTMMDREVMWGKRNRYRKLYEDWIAYLCENTEVLNNDCLMCKQNGNVVKGGIFA